MKGESEHSTRRAGGIMKPTGRAAEDSCLGAICRPGLGIDIGIAVGFDIDPDSDSDTDFETAGPINYLKVVYTVRRKHPTPPKGFAGQELALSKL